MKKRTLSLLLAIVMVVSTVYACGITAAAASDGSSGESSAEISVAEVWGNPGENVDVELTVTDNPGIQGAIITVSWDERLTLVSTASGEAFSQMEYTAPSQYVASGTNFLWDSNEVENAVDGVILILTFSVSETVQNNEILPVKVTYIKGDVVDGEDNDVILDITDGSVRAISYIPGDVNGDGRVNTRDLVMLRQYISDGCTVNPQGYNANVVTDACDVNGDGRINTRDLVRLRQYISDGSKTDPEGYNVVLKPAKMPECGHQDMQATAARASTCTESGNIAYWHCDKCGKCFSDSEGKNEISAQETIAPANGHTEVTDAPVSPTYESTGLTEGSHCSVCGAVLVAQTEIPKLEAVSHSVTYMNTKGAEIPVEKMKYNEHEGLYELPTPEVEGYKFLGWYTQSVGGELVDYISAGSTEDRVLIAHWELKVYTITYREAPVNQNVTSYTIEDQIILSDPEWSGLKFTNWTDENGTVVTGIDRGTTGNITLEAHWKSYRNNVVPAEDSNIISAYRNDMGLYYFVYKLGMIENVVISSLGDSYTKTNSAPRNLTLAETLATSKSDMTSVASTVNTSTNVTNSRSNSISWAKTNSASTNFTNKLSVGFEIGKKDVWKFGISDDATVGITWGETGTNSHTTVGGTTYSETFGKTFNTSSSVSYNESMSMSKSSTITVLADMPNGLYDYVYTTTVTVYGVVIYNPDEGDYCVGTYSTLGDLSATLMYYKQPSDKESFSCEELPFVIDDEKDKEIKGFVLSSYSVRYDANGGSGEMNYSLHAIGEKSNLSPNKFSRSGYVFAGWGTAPDGDKVYENEAEVFNIAEPGHTITLYAKWKLISYIVSWDTGEGYDISVKRTSSPKAGDKTGELDNGAAVYTDDVLEINYTNKPGYTLTSVGSQKVIVSDHVTSTTIFAKATANRYTVEYNANGGTGTTAQSDHTYNQSKALTANGFSRHGWTFLGWSTDKNAISAMYADQQSVLNMSSEPNAKVTLYAVWQLNTFDTIAFDALEINNGLSGASGRYIDLSSNFDVDTLRLQNYYIGVTLNFTLCDVNSGSDGKYIYKLQVFNGPGDTYTKLFNTGNQTIWNGEHRMKYDAVNVKFSTLTRNEIGFLFTEETYSLFGVITNTYKVYDFTMTITFTK